MEPPQPPNQSPPRAARIVRVEEVIRRLGVSRTTVWRWERAGLLPPKRQVGPNVVGWLEEEFDRFIHSRPDPNGEGLL
jgi:predicted DNA-binding transcriptional regulator AlpA